MKADAGQTASSLKTSEQKMKEICLLGAKVIRQIVQNVVEKVANIHVTTHTQRWLPV